MELLIKIKSYYYIFIKMASVIGVSKIKKKTLGGEQQKDIQDLMDQISGKNLAKPEIAMPKYNKMVKICKDVTLILSLIIQDKIIIKYAEVEHIESIKNFIESINNKIQTNADQKITMENVSEHYRDLKNAIEIKQIIESAASLKPYEKMLEKNIDFIIKEADQLFQPFVFSRLNFYSILIEYPNNNNFNMFIKVALQKFFVQGTKLYNIFTSPDVDIKDFSHSIIDYINNAKKIQELNRCGPAFEKIAQSVNILDNNFDKYYKDQVISGNQSIIMESFILDVAKENQNSISLKFQFKQIVNFFRSKRQNTTNENPQLTKIFKLLDDNFDKLDKSEEKMNKKPKLASQEHITASDFNNLDSNSQPAQSETQSETQSKPVIYKPAPQKKKKSRN